MKVVLFGAYPPPSGGNSVHIQRLSAKLLKEGHECAVVDPYGDAKKNIAGVYRFSGSPFVRLIKALRKIRQIRPDVVHFHISAMGKFLYAGPIIVFTLGNSVRKILTIHSGSFPQAVRSYGMGRLFMARKILNRFNGIICVSEEQKRSLQNNGVYSGKIVVIPAYLPPSVAGKREVDAALKQGDIKKPILVSSGYGTAIYGYDQLIEAYKSSSELKNNYRLYICLYNTFDEAYLKSIGSMISDEDEIYITRNLAPDTFAGVLSRAAVYVRATDRDGDAVAIREANAFGVPVVASDVVLRPRFCNTYVFGDIRDLANEIVVAIRRESFGKKQENEASDSYLRISELYGC
jgi:glycosyltransferase involved in cell wall biosynthesis